MDYKYWEDWKGSRSGILLRARIKRRREAGIVKRLGQFCQPGREHINGVLEAPVGPIQYRVEDVYCANRKEIGHSKRTITPEQMGRVTEAMLDIPLLRAFAGMIDMNTEKGIQSFGKMIRRSADWAEKHPEDWNTWDFHFDEHLHRDGFYYHFNHCPIADFCQKYGYEEINPVLCNIDHITMAMMHSRLIRKHTVAEGAGICDYWTVGDRIKAPQ